MQFNNRLIFSIVLTLLTISTLSCQPENSSSLTILPLHIHKQLTASGLKAEVGFYSGSGEQLTLLGSIESLTLTKEDGKLFVTIERQLEIGDWTVRVYLSHIEQQK